MLATARYESYPFRNSLSCLGQEPSTFELSRRLHPLAGDSERGMTAIGVLPGLDEVEQRGPGLVSSPKALLVEELALQRGEE